MSAETQTETGRRDNGASAAAIQARLESEREEFQRELARKAFRIAELEEELGQVAGMFESSLSWRITAPVRAARQLFARLRRN